MSYLRFNRNWKKWGRVLDLVVEGPHIKLKVGDENWQVVYHPDYENIKVYDWVAQDDEGRLVRVVPSHGSPVKNTVNPVTLKKWSEFLKWTRNFFEKRNFLEMQTPSLVKCPGTEPTLDVFITELKKGRSTETLFLPTSPEIHLKKALALGHSKIYEIAKCYRNDEVTNLHQPEFWMLEWYRSFANLFDLQKDVVEFIYGLCDHSQLLRPQVKCFSVRQLFKLHLNFDLKPDTSASDLRTLAEKQDIKVSDFYSIDDLFFILMLEKIEPQIPQEDLVFVEKYPPYQAALARKDHEGWAERFEVYWKGMELANAFDELNDPVEQRLRANEDLQKREGRTPIQLDEDFFAALESGMPPSAGIAMGLERVFMALTNISKIEELRLFPVK